MVSDCWGSGDDLMKPEWMDNERLKTQWEEWNKHESEYNNFWAHGFQDVRK